MNSRDLRTRVYSAGMRAILAAGIATGIGIGIASGDGTVDEAYEIRVLSSRPDMITGGDALVGITAAQNADVSELRVLLDGTDVTDAFRPSSPGALVGLVDGIAGSGNLGLVTADGMPKGALSLVNHPVEGPVFSGPHQRPFMCETEGFRLVSGETPGAPLDDDCSIERRIDYAYRSTEDGELKPFVDPTSQPPDLATTTTLTGATVPYIVRIETGTINRAVYQISMLHDPATDAEPDVWTAPPGWNGRLIYTFGGGCVNGWFRQGDRTGGVTDDWMLGQGYAIASSTLNVFSMRERLRNANGRTDNHVMLVEDFRHGLYSSQSPVLREALHQMDRWLAALSADTSSDPQADKVARARPAALTDACWTREEVPTRIVEAQVRGSGRCEALYPSPPSPREVAGAPLASDIVKCHLEPAGQGRYAAGFSADDLHRLRRIFPEGVCDWSRPGMGQTGLKGTWQTFH